VHATVPISQEILNYLLSNIQIGVEIEEHNRVLISFRMFRAAAEIVGVTPDLVVVLSTSWVLRMTLRAVLAWKPSLQAYMAEKDGFVYVFCGLIPAVRRYEYLWQHLTEVRARTQAGRLILDLDIHVR